MPHNSDAEQWTRHEVAAYLKIKVDSVNSWIVRHNIPRTLGRTDGGRPCNFYPAEAVRAAREHSQGGRE